MTIRYGIIGTGMMGREHIRNLVAMDGAVVTAVADPDATSRSRAARACGDRFSPRAFTDYRDLLDCDDVDAVVIATPNFTHIDIMRDVFETGKHVLLEKPMCTTLTDAEELYVKAKAHPGLVWIALEYRFMATIAAALAHLPHIGNIHMCAIREHRFPFLDKAGRPRKGTGFTSRCQLHRAPGIHERG